MNSKLQLFLAQLKTRLSGFWKWLLGAVLIVALTISAVVALNKTEDKKSTGKLEVAQVYEPSISTPLPADTNPSETSGTTNIASNSEATTQATQSETTPSKPQTTGQVAGESTTQTFIAPKTGVDPTEPIKYENSQFKIKITLPPGTQVKEESNSITFYTKTNSLLYKINILKSSDSLSTIYQQLKASLDARGISNTTITGKSAIKFYYQNTLNYVLVKNGFVYYIDTNNHDIADLEI